MLKRTDMVRWVARDGWWRKDCPLKLGAMYRITEVCMHGEIGHYYKIGGWYVMPDSLDVSPPWFPAIGELVRVVLLVDWEPGWNNNWAPAMAIFIGQTFTVESVTPNGVYLIEDVLYCWPPSCLEPV